MTVPVVKQCLFPVGCWFPVGKKWGTSDFSWALVTFQGYSSPRPVEHLALILTPVYLCLGRRLYDPDHELSIRTQRIYLRILHHWEIEHDMPQHQTCIIMKTCIMTSHVRHGERGSVIYEGLSTFIVAVMRTST